MPVGCDHKRYSCAEVGCIGDPGALTERRLWEMTKSDDKNDAHLATLELVRRGVLGWCQVCCSRCFVLNGHCRGCGCLAQTTLPAEQRSDQIVSMCIECGRKRLMSLDAKPPYPPCECALPGGQEVEPKEPTMLPDCLTIDWDADTEAFRESDGEEDISIDCHAAQVAVVMGAGQFPCLDRDDDEEMDRFRAEATMLARAVASVPKMLRLLQEAHGLLESDPRRGSVEFRERVTWLLDHLHGDQPREGEPK